MSGFIAKTAIIHPGVTLGKNVVIEDFCIIGLPTAKGNQKTIIGDNAVIRAMTIIYAGNTIGSNFQTGNKANIRENNIIGDSVSIGTLSVVEHHIEIGSNVRIHSQAFVPEFTQLGSGVWIGPQVILTNAKYPASKTSKDNLRGPRLMKNVRIGAGTTILYGIQIGEGTLVGAGSLVTKDLPAGVIAWGRPASAKRPLEEVGAYA